jgi:hypothetical protein
LKIDRIDADPVKYEKWHKSVLYLSNYRCAICGSSQKLQAHHIEKWSTNIRLRYVVSNGIALCETCHSNVTGREEHFAPEFKKIIAMRKFAQKPNKGKNKKKKWIPGRIGLRY